MRVAMVLCPSWDQRFPVFSVALLSAHLGARGHESLFFDLNKELFLHREAKAGAPTRMELLCRDSEFVGVEIERELGAYLERYAIQLLSSGAPLVCFLIYWDNALVSLEFAKRIKRLDPSRKVVFGGPACADLPRCLEYVSDPSVDAVVVGEGDFSFPDLVDAFSRSGRLDGIPGILTKSSKLSADGLLPRPPLADLSTSPTPDFSGYDLNHYPHGELTLETSRGCVRRCEFCADWRSGRKYRQKDGRRIVAQMHELLSRHPGTKGFLFADSLVNGDMRQLTEVADALIRDGIATRWSGYAIVRPEMTREFLEKLRRSGCWNLFYGVETGSDKVARDMGKNTTRTLCSRVIQDMKRTGMTNVTFLMVGYPTETESDFEQTLDFIRENAGSIGCLTISTPHVQPMADELVRYNIDPNSHHQYWATRDGANTFPIRVQRLRRALETAHANGVEVHIMRRKDKRALEFYCDIQMIGYYRFIGDDARADEHSRNAEALERDWAAGYMPNHASRHQVP
jgi:radical SAM superfamily enzyme YgiQ (UPF0313 family)